MRIIGLILAVIIPVKAAVTPKTISTFFDYTRKWHSLKSTWTLNPLNWWGFDSLPRDLSDGRGEFKVKDNQCEPASTNSNAGSDANGANGAGGGGAEDGGAGGGGGEDGGAGGGGGEDGGGEDGGAGGGGGEDGGGEDGGAGDGGAGDDGAAEERRSGSVRAGSGKKFLGRRYWYKRDPALILIFDLKGRIAGMQTATPKSTFTPPKQLQNKYYIDDDDEYWTQTVYFIDPNSICTTGRTREELKMQGTGTGLWIQTGPNPLKDVMKIPVGEEEIRMNGDWGNGECYWTMGQHYWYKTSLGMDCDSFVPFCLTYNSGRLTGFCFVKPVSDITSDRYDYPPITKDNYQTVMKTVPDCALQDQSFQTLSSIHISFLQKPRLMSLC